MRANRAKLGRRHRHANEIEAKQLDTLERETKSQYSRLPLSSLKLPMSKDITECIPCNFETIGISPTKKEWLLFMSFAIAIAKEHERTIQQFFFGDTAYRFKMQVKCESECGRIGVAEVVDERSRGRCLSFVHREPRLLDCQ